MLTHWMYKMIKVLANMFPDEQMPSRIFSIIFICLNLYACSGSTGTENNSNTTTLPLITSPPAVSIAENTTSVLTVNAADTDNGSILYSLSGGADQTKFSVNSSTGALIFLTAPDYEIPTDSDINNIYLVQISASDSVDTVSQIISVTVNNANDNNPVFTSTATQSVAENNSSVLTVNATDADNNTLAYSINGGIDQARFSINANTGVLTFIAAPDFENPTDSDANNIYLVQVNANDGVNAINQMITVTVTNTNDNNPVFTSAVTKSIVENTTSVLTVNATNAGGNTPVYSLSGGLDQTRFSINVNSGVLIFTAAPDFEIPADSDANNIYLVQVSASNGINTTNQLITVTVTNTNDNSPVFTSAATQSVAENNSSVLTVNATDADNNTLAYSINGGIDQARFSINANTGVLTFIAAPDFENPTDSDTNNIYLIQVSASDGVNAINQMITVTVTNTNDNNPVFTSAVTKSIVENTTSVLTINATDADGNTPVYSLSGGADQTRFSINVNSGVLIFITAPDFENPADSDTNNIYLVQVSASDSVNTTNQLITITVTNTNDNSPVFTSAATQSVAENNSSVLTVNATDADNNSLTYSINGGVDQAQFSINANSGALIFTTAPDFETPTDSDTNNIYLVQVNASDGVNAVNQLITVTVTDLNEAQFGLSTRPDNTTCAIANAPVLSSAIQLTRVFTNLSFASPTILLQSPVNTDRWYITEQKTGLIKTFLSADTAATNFADLSSRIATTGNEMGLLGIAFHPNFSTNNYVYVYYSAPSTTGNHQSVISRFIATNNATTLDLTTEFIIMTINQPYDNHNGGNMIFGTDGFLYIGMGDGGSGGDPQNNAQNISSYLGKMLRINVDATGGGNNYTSPTDNPYVGITGLDEIYATGLRNPWRWSFDRLNGTLIAADVGQSNREEIDIITKGGNYGWRCYEGTAIFDTSVGCQGSYFTPIYEYGRSIGQSVTGGYIYRGSAIPALYGSYIYSDFYPGPIWGLSDPAGTSPVNTSLLSTNILISSFAEDANGELYVLSFGDGLIYRIDPASGGTGSFPSQLSQTGCIDSTNPLQMASGLVPYDVNAAFWSDGAIKDRWIALPDGTGITIETNNDWSFPVNSVLVKNFNLNGKRIETRLLVRHADGNWGGYSYEWNDAETDATLLLNGKTTSKQGQTYIYPSSTDCFKCHTATTSYALSAETAQLNRDKTYASTGITSNQLATLNFIDYFSTPLNNTPANLPKLTDPSDLTASLRDRSRAYLHTNCSQCHRQGGTTNVNLDFNITTVDASMNICNIIPIHQIGGASVIMSPGNAADSSFYLRMSCRDGVGSCNNEDKMPPLGSVLVDTSGTNIVASWINSLNVCP